MDNLDEKNLKIFLLIHDYLLIKKLLWQISY
jgi:hypothetical protein